MPEIEFEGTPSGDNECFCWNVSEEEYIRICGKKRYRQELKYRKESYHHQRMEELGHEPEGWGIYPNDIVSAATGMDFCDKKIKVKVTMEIVDED